jgi:hypothetical protein
MERVDIIQAQTSGVMVSGTPKGYGGRRRYRGIPWLMEDDETTESTLRDRLDHEFKGLNAAREKLREMPLGDDRRWDVWAEIHKRSAAIEALIPTNPNPVGPW